MSKKYFCIKKIVEIAVNSAVIAHNEGILGLAEVFKLLDILPGYYFKLSAQRFDKKRLKNIELKSSERAKKRRKTLRSLKKGYFDKEQEVEGGQSYRTGQF